MLRFTGIQTYLSYTERKEVEARESNLGPPAKRPRTNRLCHPCSSAYVFESTSRDDLTTVSNTCLSKTCCCLTEYVLKIKTVIVIRIIMIILRRTRITLCKSRARMAEHKFPPNWGDYVLSIKRKCWFFLNVVLLMLLHF